MICLCVISSCAQSYVLGVLCMKTDSGVPVWKQFDLC